MRPGVSFTLTSDDRRRLETVVPDPKSPQKHVWRARIVLLSDDGLGTMAIMRETGKAKNSVWRWQDRFYGRRCGRTSAGQDAPAGQDASGS